MCRYGCEYVLHRNNLKVLLPTNATLIIQRQLLPFFMPSLSPSATFRLPTRNSPSPQNFLVSISFYTLFPSISILLLNLSPFLCHFQVLLLQLFFYTYCPDSASKKLVNIKLSLMGTGGGKCDNAISFLKNFFINFS